MSRMTIGPQSVQGVWQFVHFVLVPPVGVEKSCTCLVQKVLAILMGTFALVCNSWLSRVLEVAGGTGTLSDGFGELGGLGLGGNTFSNVLSRVVLRIVLRA